MTADLPASGEPSRREALRTLSDAYYAIPAGNPSTEQVMERLPDLYSAIQTVLDNSERIAGLLATVDRAERDGLTIHVATRRTCAEHIEAGDDKEPATPPSLDARLDLIHAVMDSGFRAGDRYIGATELAFIFDRPFVFTNEDGTETEFDGSESWLATYPWPDNEIGSAIRRLTEGNDHA